MGFTSEQVALLNKPLSSDAVKTREQSGRSLSYIEGWHAIAEANRIFGFDGWDRETVQLKEVCRIEKTGSNGKPQWKIGYEAKVRVLVGDTVREGTGHGQGTMGDLFDAIESAAKEAETDAMKRALMTFGNQFGLALYDKEQRNVASEPTAKEKATRLRAEETMARIRTTLAALDTYQQAEWARDEKNAKDIESIRWFKNNMPDLYQEIAGTGFEV